MGRYKLRSDVPPWKRRSQAADKAQLEDIEKERRRIYDNYVDEVKKRQLSSSENYDKAILTYSSGGLALSLAFMKDFVKGKAAVFPETLYASWVLFALAIILTVLSFLLSYFVQEKSIKDAEDYYLNGDESARNRGSNLDCWIRVSNVLCGLFFICAIGVTVFFTIKNLS
jgi:hypothetical protein